MNLCRTLPPGSSSTSALSTAYLSMRSSLSSCDIEWNIEVIAPVAVDCRWAERVKRRGTFIMAGSTM